jgi:seryl-tRNA synthetase
MSYIAEDRLDSIGRVLFAPSGRNGVCGRTRAFEQVIEGLSGLISRQREADAEVLSFPPVMSRRQLERSGYLQSFPNLLGCVSCLEGEEAEIRAAVPWSKHNEDWTAGLAPTELVLTPAACYPLYPLLAARGAALSTRAVFDVNSYCFRREATYEPDRFQAFRMREYVCAGSGDEALGFRADWMRRAQEMANQLGLPHKLEPASDPFFGRVGRMAALIQMEQALKFELLIPTCSEERPTACMSFNYHRDHFGGAWELRNSSGDTIHTSCVAFGMDRLAMALFVIHGVELKAWPSAVRAALSL